MRPEAHVLLVATLLFLAAKHVVVVDGAVGLWQPIDGEYLPASTAETACPQFYGAGLCGWGVALVDTHLGQREQFWFECYYQSDFPWNIPGCINPLALPNIYYIGWVESTVAGVTDADFVSLPNLQFLFFQGSGMTFVQPNAFANNTRIVDLHFIHEGLTSLDHSMIAGIAALNEIKISYNPLTTVAAGTFVGFDHLGYIKLDDNALTAIEAGTFGSLPQLEEIFLDHNVITEVADAAFSSLPSLERINLAHNKLTEPPVGAFVDLPELELLELNSNEMVKVANAFPALPKLETLLLSDNVITRIDSNMFNQLDQLELLGLGGNRLTSLVRGTLNGLVSLEKLRLLLNPSLTQLPAGELARTPKLEELVANGCGLTSLSHSMLSGLGELKDLNLASNALTSISKRAFADLANLHTLDLSDNRLTIVQPMFGGLVSLNSLILKDSPTLSSVAPFSFSELSALTSLDLSNCNISRLENSFLNGAGQRLAELDLTQNPIVRIDRRALTEGEALVLLAMDSPSMCSTETESVWSYWNDIDCTCADGYEGNGQYCEPIDLFPCADGLTYRNGSCVSCGPGHFVTTGATAKCPELECPAGSVDADNNPTTPCVTCSPNNLYVPAGSASTSGCSDPAFECPVGSLDHDQSAATACQTLEEACELDVESVDELDTLDAGLGGLGHVVVLDCSGLGLTSFPTGIHLLNKTIAQTNGNIVAPVQAIELKDNAISEIPADAIQLLRSNRPGFTVATNLVFLDVSRNKILSWPKELTQQLDDVHLTSTGCPSSCTSTREASDMVCLCTFRFRGDGTFCARAFADDELSACVAGWIDHDTNENTTCRTCNAGTHVPEGQFGPCSNFQCVAGTIDDDMDPATACVPCDNGVYVPTGSAGDCDLFNCAAGLVDHDRNAGTSCEACPAGNYVPAGSDGICESYACVAGTSDEDEDASTECSLCPNGTYVPVGSFGNCSQFECALGSTDHDYNPSTLCAVCGPGKFVTEGSMGACDLYLCSPGTIDDDSDATTPCVPCNGAPKAATGSCQDLQAQLSASGSSTADLVPVLAGVISAFVLVVLVAAAIVHRSRRASHQKRQEMHEMIERLKNRASKQFASQFGGGGDREQFEALEVLRSRLEPFKELGRGEFGVVEAAHFRPTQASDRIVVAVKRLQADNPEAQTSFLLEARLMNFLRHPNIVQVLGVCTKDMPFLLVTEFLQGGDLREYLIGCNPRQDDPTEELSNAEMTSICVSVCSAMTFLEERHVIHRDLAARNVLVGKSIKHVKLGDFGLSRTLEESEYYKKESSDKIPVKWMSPEAIRSKKYSNKSDVWSFGVLAWEVFSFGATPYGRMSAVECMMSVAMGMRLRKPVGCPEDTYAVMMRCWALSPEHRPQFCEVGEQLEKARADSDTLQKPQFDREASAASYLSVGVSEQGEGFPEKQPLVPNPYEEEGAEGLLYAPDSCYVDLIYGPADQDFMPGPLLQNKVISGALGHFLRPLADEVEVGEEEDM
eukprot:m.210632 g.210632  ORF g.210632 m.210632 type:complete len:1496 (-) comp18565_c0_seq1:394-4881(-)